MNKPRALEIIQGVLVKKGIAVKPDRYRSLEGKGFKLELGSGCFTFGHTHKTSFGITITSIEGNSKYPVARRGFQDFNVLSGNYARLISKILTIQLKNKEIKENILREETKIKNKTQQLLSKYKKYNPRLLMYERGIKIETPMVTVYIPVGKLAHIRFKGNTNEDTIKLIELLNTKEK